MKKNNSVSAAIGRIGRTVLKAGLAFFVISLFCATLSASEIAPRISIDSPYDNNAPGNLLRGQLHCHSIQDINIPAQYSVPPGELARQYCDCGFDFVALTDHYQISCSLGSCPLIWAPHSIEMTPDPFAHGLPHRWPNQPHVLAIGLDEGVKFRDLWQGVHYFDGQVNSIKQRVKNVHEAHGLALVAHPDEKGWHGLKYDDFSVSADQLYDLYKLEPPYRPDGVAIYGSGGPGHSAEKKWDELLAKGDGRIKAWGFAEEDYHPKQHYTMGKAWVAVPGLRTDSWDSVKEKLRAGDYYAYWACGSGWPASAPVPRLRVMIDTSGNAPTITAEMRGGDEQPFTVESIRFIGCIGGVGGKTLQESSGSSASYKCMGTEKYVRVRISHRVSAKLTLNIASQPMSVLAD